jgi:hypothetical protein
MGGLGVYLRRKRVGLDFRVKPALLFPESIAESRREKIWWTNVFAASLYLSGMGGWE